MPLKSSLGLLFLRVPFSGPLGRNKILVAGYNKIPEVVAGSRNLLVVDCNKSPLVVAGSKIPVAGAVGYNKILVTNKTLYRTALTACYSICGYEVSLCKNLDF